ncbi:MAG: GNAT family N-acetyltransferase [Ktedonobacteraceae bacterium]|nr:GNAT family N-acetyltransferase [Chloroflexota bacterium]
MDIVQQGLWDNIEEHSKLTDLQLLAVLLRDSDRHVVGGVLGWTKRGWVEINVVWVRADLRGKGHGTRLMQAAEQEARARGCRQVYLSTMNFEAPEWYKKLGYELIGTLEGHRDIRHHFQKHLL